MKDDRPLLLESDSEEMRVLLRSADLDEPPDGAKRRVLVGAGVVGVGVATAVTTATSVGVASHGAGATGAGAAIGGSALGTGATTAVVTAGKVGALAVGKWVAVAAVVGAGAVGAAHRAGVIRPPAPVVATAMGAPSEPSVTRQPMPEPTPMSAGETADPGVVEALPPAPPRAARLQKGSPPASADISGEIAAIEAARRAFGQGNAREGLLALDRYLQDYPHGTLQPEATVLRIEGLVAAGERTRARAIGEAFLKSHPKSPHAQRVRSLIGSGNP